MKEDQMTGLKNNMQDRKKKERKSLIVSVPSTILLTAPCAQLSGSVGLRVTGGSCHFTDSGGHGYSFVLQAGASLGYKGERALSFSHQDSKGKQNPSAASLRKLRL